MSNSQNEQTLGLTTIDDRIGETPDKDSTNLPAERRARLGIRSGEGDRTLHLGHECRPEAGYTALIEQGGFNKLHLRLGMEVVGNQLRRRRTVVKTSSPGATPTVAGSKSGGGSG